jgi:hypothetical protein
MEKTLRTLACLLLVITVGCATEQAPSDQEPVAESAVIVDHIIVGISDLDDGIAQLEALTGVRAVIGGEHPGRGTRNALISLGTGHYMELLAPVPGGVIDESDDLAADLHGFSELTPIGWAASTTSAGDLAQKLVAEGYEIAGPVAGSRVKPDGSVLEWRTLAIEQPLLAGAPFFIEWGESSVHPSESSPAGCELRAVNLQDPDSEALGELARVLGLDVGVEQGASRALEFVLECPDGVVRLSSMGSEQ